MKWSRTRRAQLGTNFTVLAVLALAMANQQFFHDSFLSSLTGFFVTAYAIYAAVVTMFVVIMLWLVGVLDNPLTRSMREAMSGALVDVYRDWKFTWDYFLGCTIGPITYVVGFPVAGTILTLVSLFYVALNAFFLAMAKNIELDASLKEHQ